jgi:MFS transporter, DHA1 family, multidrug resistance protein
VNTQLSHAETQTQPSSPRPPAPPDRRLLSGRKVMIILAVCMALQMTGFVMILPLFARRFSEFGVGVKSLGESAMAYALAATLAAPFMGALADRFGRRRLILVSLATYVLTFSGYLLASSASVFILIRGLAGAFTAGLFPAMTGIVAELAPIQRRAQWIGIVSGGASLGWIAGPILGGVLYDHWGYRVALIVSIVIALVTFATAFFTVPETHKNPGQRVGNAGQKEGAFKFGDLKSSFLGVRKTLPKPLSAFIILLWIYFAVMFAWAFIEPRFMFFAYDDLGWNSSMLGLVMSTYGVAMALGEFGLSQLSDRVGRKPVILLGLVLFSAQFIGLAFFHNYILIAAAFVVAGLGNALFDPALSASIMDIARSKHQSALFGIKSTAGSLGNILGPALIVLFTSSLKAQGIFLIALGVVLLTALLALSSKMGSRSSSADSVSGLPDEKPA